MKKEHFLIIAVSIAAIAIAGYIVTESLFLTEPVRIVFLNKRVKLEPAGGIIKGTVLIQPILLPREAENADTIVIDIFFATYMRKNRSSITVTLCQEDVKVARVLPTRRFNDNDFHRISFRGGAFHEGPARVIVEGNDGTADNAVTVWLTSHTPFGPVEKNGVIIDKGLTMRIGITDKTPPAYRSPGGRAAVWIFIFTYAGILAVACIFLYREEKARDADAFRGKHV